MDPLTTLWVLSILGAVAFAATGYWYGRMKVTEEVAAAEERARAGTDGNVHEARRVPPPASGDAEEAIRRAREEGRAEALEEAKAQAIALASEDKINAVAAAKEEAAEEAARVAQERSAALQEKAEEERAAAEDALRQLAVLREELRVEILARTEAEKRASDLTSRLVSSSQQIAALRARAGLTGDAPISTSRPSMTPAAPRVSMPPSMSHQRMAALAPGLFSELEDLRREVARLKSENESLRAAAFVKRSE